MTRQCPLLTKHKMSPATCDFPELCSATYCFWAKFHQVNAQTGKPEIPVSQQPQKDLFTR